MPSRVYTNYASTLATYHELHRTAAYCLHIQSLPLTSLNMAVTYSGNGYSSSRNHFVEPPSILDRIFTHLPRSMAVHIRQWISLPNFTSTKPSRVVPLFQKGWWNMTYRSIYLPHILIVLWVFILLWGERWVFNSSVVACDWKKWERWVCSINGADAPAYIVLTSMCTAATGGKPSSFDICRRSAIN